MQTMSRRAVPTSADADFVRATEPFRRELLAHCYRMLGSVDEAEDLVQETYLRAWRSYAAFEGRSSVRVWLYRIATNACLTALQRRTRRALPSGLGAPGDDPDVPLIMAGPGVRWLEPIPDALARPESDDPAVIAGQRAGLRLALIASLQHLPTRQRAVLILREALGWPAADVAAVLGTSTAAVKSMLQRARGRLDEVAPAADQVGEPTEPQARALLDRYMAAFENADASALERALRDDAALEMIPARTWFAGKQTCMRYLRRYLASPGEWRMVATSANAQPAAAAYRRDDDGGYNAFAIVVLTTTAAGIVRITLFADPRLFQRFALPTRQPAGGGLGRSPEASDPTTH
jgi:RNA polymerase sigma-70 factor, ECF subfamily